MDELSIVPVDVLSAMCRQAGVKGMKHSIGRIGNCHLHQAWQLAVTRLDLRTTWYEQLSPRDMQHIEKFRNLEKIHVDNEAIISDSSLAGWQLVSRVAPALSKLTSISLRGSSSFELLT